MYAYIEGVQAIFYTITYDQSDVTYNGGIACLPDTTAGFYITNACLAEMSGSYLRNIVFAQSSVEGDMVQKGSRFVNSQFVDITTPFSFVNYFLNTSGYAATRLDGGCKFIKSDIYIGASVTFNAATYGIEVIQSRVQFNGVVTGTGNTFGMYIHQNSYCKVVSGSVPTLSGSSGDVTVDGSTQATTWATVDGGTALRSTTEFSIVTE
jgi:hypothetical protein